MKTPLSIARTAWQDETERDERFVRRRSEQRLARAWPAPRAPLSARRLMLPLAAGALLALGAQRIVSTPAAMPVAPAHRSTVYSTDSVAQSRHLVSGLVALVDCGPCSVHAGTTIAGPVFVPKGARLTVGWAFVDGEVDSHARLEIVGPARMSADGTVVALEEGTTVDSLSGGELSGGESKRIEPSPSNVPTARVTTEEIALPAPLDQAQANRASFHEAQLELARGDVASARGRLRTLLTIAEPQLASDAWFLLSRSFPEPQTQLGIWNEALGHPLSEAHRAQARLERARVLVHLGRTEEAKMEALSLAASAIAPDPVRAGAKALLGRR